MPQARRSIEILLGENSDGHAELTEASLHEAGVVKVLHRVRDGREALVFLENETKRRLCAGRSPLLVVLDINLPEVDGLEVLRSLKNDLRYRWIPVVMMSASYDLNEAERSRHLGCDAYVSKWAVFLGLMSFVRILRHLTDKAWAAASSPSFSDHRATDLVDELKPRVPNGEVEWYQHLRRCMGREIYHGFPTP